MQAVLPQGKWEAISLLLPHACVCPSFLLWTPRVLAHLGQLCPILEAPAIPWTWGPPPPTPLRYTGPREYYLGVLGSGVGSCQWAELSTRTSMSRPFPPKVDLVNPCEVPLVLTVLVGDLVAGANLSVVFLTCPCQPCGLRASLLHSAPSLSLPTGFLALRSVCGCLKCKCGNW